MQELSRISDLTAALNVVKVQNEKLETLTTLASKWTIEFDISIDGATKSIDITAKKPNGHGFTHRVDAEKAIYHSADPESFIASLADYTYEQLLREMIREELRDPMKLAFNNIVSLQKSKLK